MPQQRRKRQDPTDALLQQIDQVIGPDPIDSLLADIDKAIGQPPSKPFTKRDDPLDVSRAAMHADPDAFDQTMRDAAGRKKGAGDRLLDLANRPPLAEPPITPRPSYGLMADTLKAPAGPHVPSDIVPSGQIFRPNMRPAPGEPITPIVTGPSMDELAKGKKADQDVELPETGFGMPSLRRPPVAPVAPPPAVLLPMQPVPAHGAEHDTRAALDVVRRATTPPAQGRNPFIPDAVEAPPQPAPAPEPTFAGEAAKGLVGGLVAGPAEALAATGEALGLLDPEVRANVQARNRTLEPAVTADVFENPAATLGDPLWWAHTGGQVTGSVLSLMGAGGAGVKMATGAGKALKLGPDAAARLVKIGGPAAATLAETWLESFSAYATVRERGGTRDAAAAAAAKVAAVNLPLLGATNLPLFNPQTKSRLLNAVFGGVLEGPLQEAPQQMATNAALGDPLLQGVGTSAVVGSLTGATFGGLTRPKSPPSPDAVVAAIDDAIGPSEPRSVQGPTTSTPVAVRPGVSASVGPVAPSPAPSPDASTVASTAPAPEFMPVGAEPPITPRAAAVSPQDDVIARVQDKLAHGERLGTEEARQAFDERQRVEAVRKSDEVVAQIDEAIGPAPTTATQPIVGGGVPMSAEEKAQRELENKANYEAVGGDAGHKARMEGLGKWLESGVRSEPPTPNSQLPTPKVEAPKVDDVRTSTRRTFSKGYDKPNLHERRELGVMLKEMENIEYTSRSLVKFDNARPDEWLAGSAGAEVFSDIKGSNREAVSNAIRRVLSGKKATAIGERAIDIARKRLDASGYVSPRVLPVDAGNEPGLTYVESTPDMTAAEAAVERPFREAVENRTDKMVRAYRKRFPDVISADDAKEMSPEYAVSNENRAQFNRAVHRASSALADARYRTELQEPPKPGKDPEVTFLAGPTGTGKTTVSKTPGFAEALADSQIVVDGPFTRLGSSERRIRQALDAGKQVRILYVHRDPVEAWRGVLARGKVEGRQPNVDVHIQSHVEGLATIHRLSDMFADDPRVTIEYARNTSGATPELIARAALPEAYNEEDVRSAVEAAGHAQPAQLAAEVAASAEVPSSVGRGGQQVRPELVDGVQPASHPAEEVAPAQSSPDDIVQQIDAAIGQAEQPREFSSTQIDLPTEHAAALREMAATIPDADLAEDGRENDPHVTVKFGLHTNDVEDVRRVLANEPPITVTLGKTSIFPAKEGAAYDVVKVDVDSPDLHRLNAKIAKALEHTDTHPTYKPHATLAYVTPGQGQKYVGRADLDGRTMTLDAITFSGKDRQVISIPLTGKPSVPVTPRVDILDTGETQDRLPGDVGAVRDRELPTPKEEAPFSLELETASRTPAQPTLREEPPARAEPPFTYHRGDKAVYTGKTQQLHGATFYEATLVEGHRAGETIVTQQAPKGEIPIAPKADRLGELVGRYKPGNPFAVRAARARQNADRLNRPTAHEKGMADSFPLGAGFGRGSQRSRDKKTDASVARATEAVHAGQEAEYLEAQAAAFDAGKINAQGRRWDSAKQKESEKRESASEKREARIAAAKEQRGDKPKWQVPPAIWADSTGNLGGGARRLMLSEHREAVETALAEGKDVPADVLAEYPDLKAKPKRSGGGDVLSAVGARRDLPPAPTGTVPVTERMRPSAIIEKLRKGLGDIPVSIGRFKQQAHGIYKIGPQAVRLKVANNLQTLTHEIGHHIDHAILGISYKDARWRDELQAMGQATSRPSYSVKEQRSEGAAEFLRMYLIEPHKAAADAPAYFAEFERRLAEHPDVRTVLHESREDLAGLIAQDPATRGKLRIDFTGKDSAGIYQRLKDDPKGEIRNLATLWIDDLQALKVAVEEMRDARPIDARENAYVLARNARGTGGMAEGMLSHGVRGRNGRFLSGSLGDAITPVKAHLEEFAAYLTARRVLEVQALKRKETGMSADEARAIVTEVEAGPRAPEMRQAADNVYAYQQALLTYAKEYHAISKEQYQTLLKEAHYVPLQRVMDAVGGAMQGSGAKKLANRSSPIKRMKGSGRDIVNPLESIIRNTFAIVDMVEKNRAMQALVRQADKSAGSAKWLEAVPAPQIATQFSLSQIEKTVRAELEDAGVDVPDNLDLDALVTVFTPAQMAMPGQNLVTVIRDGKRQFYEVHDQALYDAITAIGSKASSTLVEWASKPAALIRAGATLTPGFIARNPTRDTLVAFMQSRYGFIPVYDTIRGFLSLALGEHEAKLFLTSGVQQSSLVGADRDRLRKKIEAMSVQSRAQFLKSVVRHPVDLLRALSETMEVATRLGEFRLAINTAGKERRAGALGVLDRLTTKNTPAVDDETLTRATLAARDVTTDFSRGGSLAKEVSRVKAFFNARVQGYVRMVETAQRDPVGTALNVTLLALLSYALWWANQDDDEYDEIPDWEKNAFWHIPTPSGFIKVAKPFEWAYMANLTEAALAHVKGKNPDALARIKPGGDLKALAFALMPSALTPVLEAAFNYDTFRSGPIVKPWDTGLEPELQRSEWTTDTGVALGTIMGVSPAKVDHLIFGYGAGFARGIVEHGTDQALGALPDKARAIFGITPKKAEAPEKKWQRVPIVGTFLREGSFDSSSQSLKDFYVEYDRVIDGERSAKRFADTDPKNALAFVKERQDKRWVQRRQEIKAAKSALEDLGDEVNAIYAAPPSKATPEQKRAALDKVYERMVKVARQALGKPPLRPTGTIPITPRAAASK